MRGKKINGGEHTMPRKKQEVETVRVPTTMAIGMVEQVDTIIRNTRKFKSRSDFLEKATFLLIKEYDNIALPTED